MESSRPDRYAEFSNVSFFRPEPGRNLTLTLQAAFWEGCNSLLAADQRFPRHERLSDA